MIFLYERENLVIMLILINKFTVDLLNSRVVLQKLINRVKHQDSNNLINNYVLS